MDAPVQTTEGPDPQTLPLKTNHDVLWAHSRYTSVFECPSEMQDRIPRTNIPGPSKGEMVPWIIEAPLNSVEILEAFLKPSEPFEIHTARHIPRGCRKTAMGQRYLNQQRRLYHEYTRFQGRLAEDREVSFVCVPTDAAETIRRRVWGTFWPVKLHYISIPWCDRDDGQPSLQHPWALVLHDKPYPGTLHTFENRFAALLEELDIVGCSFQRSLLKPGTTPVPECLWDWFAGVPGKTVALPYYAPGSPATKPDEMAQDGATMGCGGGGSGDSDNEVGAD